MKIALITPVPAQSRQGNRVTALRWARILKSLGHQVCIAQHYNEKPCELMVALHARRSFAAIAGFHRLYPTLPLLVALTGTDLYGDIRSSAEAQASLELATRLILLQPKGLDELPVHLHPKVRIIYQSVPSRSRQPAKAKTTFDVCVLGHLRPVKDPFRTALAARLLPPTSRLRVMHVGKALSADMETRARAEMTDNPRYRWLGELPRWQALRVLARSRLLALSSHMEGGANVLSEALALGVPIVASHIAGSIGILGDDYPGYFPVEDTAALAQLLDKAEGDPLFYRTLSAQCTQRAALIQPWREQQAWQMLLDEVTPCLMTPPMPRNAAHTRLPSAS